MNDTQVTVPDSLLKPEMNLDVAIRADFQQALLAVDPMDAKSDMDEPLPPSLRRTWGDTTTMADRPKRGDVMPVIERPDDLDRAANVMCAWLLDHVAEGEAHHALCELHYDVWRDAAEAAVRAARGEFDTRPERFRAR